MPSIFKTRGKTRLIAFPFWGGKFYHLDWLLPLLPRVHHYCEPFAGSAVVLLNREPSPVETLNDINGEIINFFFVLREKPGELIRKLELTPYSRQEFLKSFEITEELSDVERARRFYIRVRQSRDGIIAKSSWSYARQMSRKGMSARTSAWLSGIEMLQEIAERLRTVQIENDDAFRVIARYDDYNVLFYCDPPYPEESRTSFGEYLFEMTNEDHRRLSELLHNVKAKVALSGYHCELLDRLYEDFYCFEAPGLSLSGKKRKQEVLWTNYNPKIMEKQLNFDECAFD